MCEVKYARKQRAKRRLLERSGGTCFYCLGGLTIETMTRDHLFPKSKGTVLSGNMVIACAGCNRRKGAQIPCRDIFVRYVLSWALHPFKTSAIGELYHEFHQEQALISKLSFFFGEPNIPGMIRAHE